MRYALYGLVQLTWGFPQTIAGACVRLAHCKKPWFRYHGALVTVWESCKALSLGPFIFIGATRDASSSASSPEENVAGASSPEEAAAVSAAFSPEEIGAEETGASTSSPEESVGVLTALPSRARFPQRKTAAASSRSLRAFSSGENARRGVVPEGVDRALLVHEYGHTVQSLILGPAYLLVVGLPSLIWLNTPVLSRRRRRNGTSYYSFYTERTANLLGELALKEASIGFVDID